MFIENRDILVQMKDLKTALDFVSLLSLVMIILGYFNIHTYYYTNFRISIYQYLEPTEVLFSFASVILNFSIIVLLYFFFEVMDIWYYDESQSKWLSQDEFKRKFGVAKSKFLLLSMLVVQVYCGFVGGFYLVLYEPDSHYEYNEYVMFFLIVVVPFALLYVVILNDKVLRSRTSILTLSFGLMLFFMYLYLKNDIETKLLSKGIQKDNITLVFDDGAIIRSNADTVYIGGTSRYHFFRLTATDENLVVPSQHVKVLLQEYIDFRVGSNRIKRMMRSDSLTNKGGKAGSTR